MDAREGPRTAPCGPLTHDQGTRILAAVKGKYKAVADAPEGHFSYLVGRESARDLGYESGWLETLPPQIVDRFVGVGNPFSVRRPEAGDRVLDVGCGSGFDTFVASLLVGPTGRAVGLDLTREMLLWPRKGLGQWPSTNIEFLQGSVQELPFRDESFDLIISNGVLNLVPDKDLGYSEIFRVLKPGGRFAAADLLLVETIPEEKLADMDAWSN